MPILMFYIYIIIVDIQPHDHAIRGNKPEQSIQSLNEIVRREHGTLCVCNIGKQYIYKKRTLTYYTIYVR